MGLIFAFLFRTKIGHLVLAGLVGIMLVGLLKVGLWMHDNQVRNEALMKFNQTQMELVLNKQAEFADHMKKLDEQGALIMNQMKESNDKIDAMTGDIKDSLDNLKVPGKDDKISPYMEETIKQLERMERRK